MDESEQRELRIEALRLAVQARPDAQRGEPIVNTAKLFYAYIADGRSR